MKEKLFNRYILSMVISLSFALFSLFIFGTCYDQSDDYYMSFALQHGDKVLFINYFLGVIIAFIQSFMGDVNAFVLSQLLFAFIAMYSINVFFFTIFKRKISIPIVIILDLIITCNHFCKVGFTQLSTLLIATGVIYLVYGVINKKIKCIVFGDGIFIIGSFYRYQNSYVGLAFIFVFLFIYYVFYNSKTIKEKAKSVIKKNNILYRSVPLLFLVLVVFAANYVSTSIYHMDPDFSKYISKNSARSYVEDFPILPYQDNEEAYQKLSLSENDYQMITHWMIDGAFENEQLEGLRNISKVNNPTGINLIRKVYYYFKINLSDISDIGIFIIFYILLSIIFMLINKLKYYLYPIGITMISGVLCSYLIHIQRIPYRVAYGIWFLAVLLLLFSFSISKKNRVGEFITNKHKAILNLSLIIGLVFFSGIYIYNFNYNFGKYMYPEKNEEIYDYIESSDKDFAVLNEYMSIRASSPTYRNPLSLEKDIYRSKCISWGITYYDMPFYNDSLKEFGITNLYYDLVDNEEIQIIDNFEATKLKLAVKYINEHSNKDEVDYLQIDTVGNYGIYKIFTK